MLANGGREREDIAENVTIDIQSSIQRALIISHLIFQSSMFCTGS